MPKRISIDELEKAVAEPLQSDTQFFELADILLVDYLAFTKTEQYWSFNFDKKGCEKNITAYSPGELDAILGTLMMEARNGKPRVPKDVSFGQRYKLGVDEVLISAYYLDVMELGLHKPKAITVSSTTDFGLGKELVHVDNVRKIYSAASEKTGKDPLMLLFEDNKIVARPADMFKDNLPRYNLNLKYLVEATKLARQQA